MQKITNTKQGSEENNGKKKWLCSSRWESEVRSSGQYRLGNVLGRTDPPQFQVTRVLGNGRPQLQTNTDTHEKSLRVCHGPLSLMPCEFTALRPHSAPSIASQPRAHIVLTAALWAVKCSTQTCRGMPDRVSLPPPGAFKHTALTHGYSSLCPQMGAFIVWAYRWSVLLPIHQVHLFSSANNLTILRPYLYNVMQPVDNPNNDLFLP